MTAPSYGSPTITASYSLALSSVAVSTTSPNCSSFGSEEVPVHSGRFR